MGIQFGCAPINWTNDDLPSLGGELTYQQCLSETALAGFAGIEGGGAFPKDLAVMQKALALRGLTLCNTWFSSRLSTFENQRTYDEFLAHMEFTYAQGARVIGVGEVGVTIHGQEETALYEKAPVLDDKQMENMAKGLNHMGAMAKEKGMKVCFHPHLGTGIETGAEIQRLMDLTDPELVYLVLDTGHTTAAGENPVALLKQYANRVGHLHVKDLRSGILAQLKAEGRSFLWGVQAGVFTVPGDGDMVDWDNFFATVKEIGYDGWIVVEAEQDPAKADPLEYAQKARSFMRAQLEV